MLGSQACPLFQGDLGNLCGLALTIQIFLQHSRINPGNVANVVSRTALSL